MQVDEFFKGKNVIITGGCGTVGIVLAEKLLSLGVKTLRLLDQDDSALTFAFDALSRDPRLRLFLGKIEDKDRLLRAFSGTDIVFHLAAIKHVSIAEYNPFDTITVNVIGTQNVITTALECNVKQVIFTSTDKAVNPPNTYGTTKSLAEKLMITANLFKGAKLTKFSIVRFGNVIGSRGSVIPRFKEQLHKFNKIWVTKRDVTRFVMLMDEAVDLLIESSLKMKGGEIFVLKMIPIVLGDLADCVLELHKDKYPTAIQEEIGLFRGEKEYEELLDIDDEGKRVIEEERMFIILPSYSELQDVFKEEQNQISTSLDLKQITSKHAEPITKDELMQVLIENNLI